MFVSFTFCYKLPRNLTKLIYGTVHKRFFLFSIHLFFRLNNRQFPYKAEWTNLFFNLYHPKDTVSLDVWLHHDGVELHARRLIDRYVLMRVGQ